jgi:L-fuculose-phosphate aldolase
MNIDQLKQEICEIGRRIYNKGFAAGNAGNISCRLSESEVLCTPTLISKGFMTPDDLCTVDMQGKQLSGTRKCSSEIRLHLTILRERADVNSVVHCHPPHASAFAVTREPLPQGLLPEVEVFLGPVPVAEYRCPGNQEFADTVLPHCQDSSAIILANHGTVSFGDTVEHAYWWTEVLDAYCRIVLMAKSLGGFACLSDLEMRELLAHKKKMGFKDSRYEAMGI